MNILSFIILGFVAAHSMSMSSSSEVPYGTICMGILGTNYLFPGGECTTSYRKAECYCGDDDFVESVVGCVNQYMANITEHHRNHTKMMSYHQVMHTCSNLTMPDIMSYESKIHDLPVYFGRDSGKRPGKWPVKSAFLLTDYELSHAVKAYKVPLNRMKKNTRYGSALIAYWGAVLLAKGVIHWFTKVFPQVPLLLGNTTVGRFYRRIFEIHCYKFSLNTLMQMLTILGFIILTVLLSFCDLPYYSPDYSFQYSNSTTYGHLLGARTGDFCLYILPLFFVFAGRNNFLQYLTGWTQEPFLVFHRWIARVEIALLLAHTIAFTIQRAGVHYYHHMWSEAYWSWGIVGFAFGAFIFVQSLKYIRRAHYELFLALHVIAAIFFLIGGYYHLKFLEEMDDLNFFWASIAVWAFDRVARICRVLYAGPKKCHITLVDQNMLALTLKKPAWWPVAFAPGTYAFVHFLKPLQFLQSHPLTLTSSCSDPTMIKLYFRVYSGISKTLAKEVAAAGENGKDMYIMLDGPYGASYDLLEYDECVFIAGGSGITTPLAYIQNALLKVPCRKFQKTTLYWAVSDRSALSWFSEELRFLQEEAEVNICIYVSRKELGDVIPIESDVTQALNSDDHMEKQVVEQNSSDISTTEFQGRLDVARIIETSIVNTSGNMSIMCCGPTTLHVATRQAISKNLHKSRHFVQYFEESYTW